MLIDRMLLRRGQTEEEYAVFHLLDDVCGFSSSQELPPNGTHDMAAVSLPCSLPYSSLVLKFLGCVVTYSLKDFDKECWILVCDSLEVKDGGLLEPLHGSEDFLIYYLIGKDDLTVHGIGTRSRSLPESFVSARGELVDCGLNSRGFYFCLLVQFLNIFSCDNIASAEFTPLIWGHRTIVRNHQPLRVSYHHLRIKDEDVEAGVESLDNFSNSLYFCRGHIQECTEDKGGRRLWIPHSRSGDGEHLKVNLKML